MTDPTGADAPSPPRRRGRPPGSRSVQGKIGRPRREEVIKTATRVFAEKGYDATRTQDIGDALGLLKGSLYYYIDAKEDLLFAVVDSVHRDVMENNFDRARGRSGPVVEQLRSTIHDMVAGIVENLDRIKVFYQDFRWLGPDRQAEIIRRRDEYEVFLRDLVRRGQTSGEIREDLDATFAVMGFLAMVKEVHVWYRPDGRYTPAEIADLYTTMILHGIANPT